MISALGDMVHVVTAADPQRKAKIYAGLVLRLTFHSAERRVLVSQATGRET
jgi:hypothetical protein